MGTIVLEILADASNFCDDATLASGHSSPMDIHKRIKQKRLDLGLSMKELAERIGVSSWQTVQQWEKEDGTAPSRKRLQKVAEVLKTTEEWLLWGKDSDHAVDEPQIPSDEEFALVPQLDLSASCGNGKFADHVVVKGGLAFKKSFMAQFGLTETTARIIYAEGNSMEPTIGDGRVVLIKLNETDPQDGRVFLICDQDGAMILKRLVREYDSTLQRTVWKLRSDNPDKRQFADKMMPEDNSVTLVGRAIWHDGLL